jgi:uncharacterized protein YggE
MDKLIGNLTDIQKRRFFNGVTAVVILLAVFLGFKALNTIKEFSYVGKGVYPTKTISVSGRGEVFAIPDTGSFSVTVTEEGKTVKDAQDKASKKINSVIDAVKDMNVEEKDIKTTGYNSYPKYEWQNAACPRDASGVTTYCPPGKQVLTGYEVSQTLTIKVRKTEDAGEVLTKVGTLGASNISGLSFVTDDMESVKAEARNKAIADAKAKAKILSKSLGVKLTKIISFSDSLDQPIWYGGGMMGAVPTMMESKNVMMDVSVAPEIPVGENQVVSIVTITYEVSQ